VFSTDGPEFRSAFQGLKSTAIRHVYFHIPFCTHICPYCSFVKTRNLTRHLKPFPDALRRELEEAGHYFDLAPETVFFGGGTPSALSLSQIEQVREFWPWESIPEFTLEANPVTISEKKAEALLEWGVNRISLGVQAFDEDSLQLLGRAHRRDGVLSTVRCLQRAGFENLNIDLMFALPGQSLETFLESLDQALALNPQHLSLYELTLEEDTEFLKRYQAGELAVSPEGAQMHEEAIRRLGREGFRHYEVSNFARPGYECRHNLACWRGEDYLGLGPGACSTVGANRWMNCPDIESYLKNPLQACLEVLGHETRRFENLYLGLRTDEGVPLDWVPDDRRRALEKENLAATKNGRMILQGKGRLLVDAIVEDAL